MRGRGFSRSGHRGIALLTAFIVLCLGAGHIGLNRAKTANACPTQTYYTLTVTVEPAGGGSVSCDPSLPQYISGSQVELEAVPTEGWRFDHWECQGDPIDQSTDNPYLITMNSEKHVTAVFIELVTLTVSKTGQGTLNPDVGAHEYDKDSEATVTAENIEGWKFDRWEQDLFGGVNPGSLTMDSDKSVKGVFLEQFILTTGVTQGGAIYCFPDQEEYSDGAVVEVFAQADAGWRFDHWEGDLKGSDNPTTLTMDADKTITAVFLPYTLSITGATQNEPFMAGQSVSLQAVIEPTPPPGTTYTWTAGGDASTAPASSTGSTFNPTFEGMGSVLVSVEAEIGDVSPEASINLLVYSIQTVPSSAEQQELEVGNRLTFQGIYNSIVGSEEVSWSYSRPLWNPIEYHTSFGDPYPKIQRLEATLTSLGENTLTFSLSVNGKVLEIADTYDVGFPNGPTTIEKGVITCWENDAQRIAAALPRINQELQNDTDGDDFNDVACPFAYSWQPLESNILFPDPFYYPADMNWYLGYWDDKDVAVVSLIYDPLLNVVPGLCTNAALGNKIVVSTDSYGVLWILTFHELGHQAGHGHDDYCTPNGLYQIMHTDAASFVDTDHPGIRAASLPWED